MIKQVNKKANVVVGLGFGDEGKGAIVDFLCRKFSKKVVVRFNGGSQAAHNVVSPNNVHHCFAQVGAGSLISEVKTYLSQFMYIDPLNIKSEIEVLQSKVEHDVWRNLFINENCFIITPYHWRINRLREISRGHKRHGSCGKGVGETVLDSYLYGTQVLQIKDLSDEKIIRKKLNFIRLLKLDILEEWLIAGKITEKDIEKFYDANYLESLINDYLKFYQRVQVVKNDFLDDYKNEEIVFEGAQGVLLDPEIGFFPHVTKTRTTTLNAERLIENLEVVGILRAYQTRHGFGPMPTINFSLMEKLPDKHNKNNEWQSVFKVGWLDLVLTKYSLNNQPVDYLALTNIDRLFSFKRIKICAAYRYNGKASNQELKKFFKVKGRIIKEIKVFPRSRDEQKKLTALLFDCRPMYKNFAGWQSLEDENLKVYLKFIENQLSKKIKIISSGPKPEDKIYL